MLFFYIYNKVSNSDGKQNSYLIKEKNISFKYLIKMQENIFLLKKTLQQKRKNKNSKIIGGCGSINC